MESKPSVKQEIAIVWFKRDLRIIDHQALYLAQNQQLPILLLYCFEPSVMQNHDSDVRHWRFVYESILDLQNKLNSNLHIFHAETLEVLEKLKQHFHIKHIFSHQEIGNKLTFDRDKAVKLFCDKNKIEWTECQTNGVIRKLKSRKDWQKIWKQTMEQYPYLVVSEKLNTFKIESEIFGQLKRTDLPSEITCPNPNFQQGGETMAWRYLNSFLKDRYVNYSKHISKPALSRKSCSRISPYLAYGNISMRMVFQQTMQRYPNSSNKRALSNFVSRLHWHCHFIQKFEDECSMEFENVNKAYDELVKPRNPEFIKAWQEGITGVPIVDACIRCLIETGYINFRMRAMVVSFFVFNLWQDWRELHFLAKQFLDYEPGIHYPQLQMQSGVTGINTIRIYNPIKNSQEHDPEGVFIKRWLHELANVPTPFVHEPWKLSNMEQTFYGIEIGKDYPYPIVDIEKSRKAASEIVWSFRKNTAVKKEGSRILKKHVNADRKKNPSKKLNENATNQKA